MHDNLEQIRKNHLEWLAFYKAMNMEDLFYVKFWDGYTDFDDYVAYGDNFHKLSMPSFRKERKYQDIRSDLSILDCA